MAHGLRHENINPLIGNWCLSSCLLSIWRQCHWIRITHERTSLICFDLCTPHSWQMCDCRLAGRSHSYGDGFWILLARFAARRINYGRHKARLVVSIKFADRFSSRHALFALVHVARAWCIDVEKLCGRRQMGAESHRLRSESFLRSTRCTDTDENSKTYELLLFRFARAAVRHPPFHAWSLSLCRTTLDGSRTIAKCKRTRKIWHTTGRRVLIWYYYAGSCCSWRTVLHAVIVGRRDSIENKETAAADTAVCVKGGCTARSNKYHETMLGRTAGNATRF